MGQKGTGKANKFSKQLNAELRAEIARQRKSLRELEAGTGISKSRLGAAINKDESPINTNELDSLCNFLRLTPSSILRKAEQTMSPYNFALAAHHSTEQKGEPDPFE